VTERFWNYFAARDWAALGEVVADDISSDDRRRVVNAGIRHGRDAEIAEMRAIADTGTANVTFSVTATRGQRLALCRFLLAGRDRRPEAFRSEMLGLVEINAESQLAARVLFDVDDTDAAFAELDTWYLAGEAAAHSHTWSVIAGECAAFNRHELPAADWVTTDHRPLVTIEGSDLLANIRATWDLTPDISFHIEAVHRLSSFGAVVTTTAHGTSAEGFDAEWRMIQLLTVEGDRIDRCEIFDEADIDAALARFEELHPQARRLENAASHVSEHFLAYFAAGDWDAMAEILADNFSQDDRRRVVGAGVRHGRDAQIADMRAIADLGTRYLTWTVLATRGERLALVHNRLSFRDQGPEGFLTDVLVIVEINADGQVVAAVSFDLDDIDAAFEELDARYLAGEATAHSQTWSVIARIFAAFNRHELSGQDFDIIDHRRGALFASRDMNGPIRAIWDLTPDLSVHIEAVHRLSGFGAVVTTTAHGTSPEGFDAEWRMIQLLTVEGDRIKPYEFFDEADLDAALARFEELRPQPPRLENAASRLLERDFACAAARDWAAMADILADDSFIDDRRRVVNSGLSRGRDAVVANLRGTLDLGVEIVISELIATRGRRLVLSRVRWSASDQGPQAFHSEALCVTEVETDERIAAFIMFDLDDLDAAFEELDARYLAGEAGAHSHTWSVIAQGHAGFNRHELPATTRDPVYIDHRPVITIEGVDLAASVRAVWDQLPQVRVYVEAVHRLSELGAVVTQALTGTSQEGFDAEWRIIAISTVDGDLTNRFEVFDEADLDAAFARFEELHEQARRPENAASQLIERFQAYFAARNWAAIAEISAAEIFTDDRRSVVSSGILRGRDIDIANIRATADLGAAYLTSTVIATRGERLALARLRLSGRDQRPEAFHTEMLGIVEIDADNRFTARILFDLDDINTAFDELDTRYLAGEAAAHSHTWSVIAGIYAGVNRHQLPATTSEFVYIDHRPLVTIEAHDLPATIRAVWDLTPDISTHIEAVHRLSDLGAVITHTARGISHEDFDAEWRMINIFTVEGSLVSRCEMFEEADLDAALAKFDELSSRPGTGGTP
jgi:hypothetical protein